MWCSCDPAPPSCTCPAASVSPHKALEADPTQSPNAGTSPFLQFIEIPAMDSPKTCTELQNKFQKRKEKENRTRFRMLDHTAHMTIGF